MATDNDALVRRWFQEVWNERRTETIDELLAGDVVLRGLQEVRGLEAFKEFHRQFCTAFPDLRITIEFTLVQGDRVVQHCSVEGTHTGPLLGIAPTQRRIKISGTGIARVRDGRFVEVWDQYDFLTLYGQLGVLDQIHSRFAAAAG